MFPKDFDDDDSVSTVDLTHAQLAIRVRRNKNTTRVKSVFSERYWDDPVAFVHDCFNWKPGAGPAVYQEEILSEILPRKRVAFYGPHGIGKTSLEAWFILWFALTRDGEDWKLPTTASSWRQLTKFLWPEIHKWSRLLKHDKILRGPFDDRQELLQLSLKLRTGEAFAVASDDSAMIEGAHADHLAYSFDEAKGIPPSIWDSAEGAFSTGDCIALAASTPRDQQGRFFQICSKKPGYEDWWVRHVSLEEAIKSGRISKVWADQRKRQWGETSAIYINRVLGQFADSDDATVIPLRWVEAANERWQDNMDKLDPDSDTYDKDFTIGPMISVGVDVSSGGPDRTVIAKRHAFMIPDLIETHREDVMSTVGRVKGVVSASGEHVIAIVDSIGVGAGVVARLRELGIRVYAFNAGERTSMHDSSGELGFINKRAAAWWHMREILDPENQYNIALPPHELLIGDLTAPKWKVTSNGMIQIESKDDIRELLERSTDHGDAVVQAFWLNPGGTTAEIASNPTRWKNRSGISGYVESQDTDDSYNESALVVTSPSRWRGR